MVSTEESPLTFYLKLALELLYLIPFAIYAYARLPFKKIFPSSPKSIDNEIILITGSSNGIGREITLNLAKNHPTAKLILWDCDDVGNKKTAELVKDFGAKAYVYKIDISDRLEVERTAAKVSKEVGDITILFNNAGVGNACPMLEQSSEQIEKTVNVNLLSHFWTLRAFLPKMIEKNHGHIVTTASVSAFGGMRYEVAYTATKWGVRGYLLALKSELRAHHLPTDNVKFTTVYPYFVKTNMTTKVQLRMKLDSLNKFLGPAEVAKKAVDGMLRNEENVVVPWDMELPALLSCLMPSPLLISVEDWLIHDSGYNKDDGVIIYKS